MKTVTAVIPVREGSERVPNKNFREFGNRKSLLELKIEQMLEIEGLNSIVVHSESNIAEAMASKYNVDFIRRDKVYASSACNQSIFFHNLAETIYHSEFIMHVPCTSPFLKNETIQQALYINEITDEGFDSINTVIKCNDYLWYLDEKEKTSINYSPLMAPNSQDLPNIGKLTFGLNLIDRKIMLDKRNVVGIQPYFIHQDQLESFDIDTPLDFQIAQMIFKSNNKF